MASEKLPSFVVHVICPPTIEEKLAVKHDLTVCEAREAFLSRPKIRFAEVIEAYPTDTPYPSRLILGWAGGRPLHVVVADNAANDEVIIITAYGPDSAQWDAEFRRRKV